MDSQNKIIRSDGVTSAERYLKKLCERSFLSMWSYVGVFNDKEQGQEVCDLLVVFGDHIIIFSDKDCEFPNTDNIELNWRRWYRKAIKKSADQVYGAERWISKFPDRLFLDQTCKIPFPIPLPETDKIKFHRIVVAHSASAKCKEIYGGSGSLMIDTQVIGDEQEFTIGKVEPTKGFIHVFDDTTLDILLGSLDTIVDFTEYLEKREILFNRDISIASTGEEELLADYLKNLNKDGKHDFDLPNNLDEFDRVFLDDEGAWEKFSRSPVRLTQLSTNRISYLWDELIEYFAKAILGGTTKNYGDREYSISEQEMTFRLMASEPRTRRRALSKRYLDLIKNTPKDKIATQTTFPDGNEDFPTYVFLALPFEKSRGYENYRRVRGQTLKDFCLLTKLRCPQAKHIIGIATESGRTNKRNKDAIYLDITNWTEENQKDAEDAKDALQSIGLARESYKETRIKVKEYPYDRKQIKDFETMKGRVKNLPCYCGSGKKYKKCHGGM